MKDRTLIFIAIALSVISMAYSTWVYWQGSDVLATRALKRREKELVQSLAPKFVQIYKDMLPNQPEALKSPTTLEELITPLVKLMEGFGDNPSSKTNSIVR